MKITLPWRRQPAPPAADPEPPRRPAPQPDPTDPQTDAAIRTISEIARHWIDIAGEQAQEIARLRAQLAEREAALQQLQRSAATLAAENDAIRRVAIHWHTTAEAQRRAALPEAWARNAARYISRN